MKIIITRHGETVENANNIAQGQMHGTLSEKGKEQARKLAARLKGERVDAIYSSDLARAADTAREIIKFHPNVPACFTEELRERDLKGFEGIRHDEAEWDKETGDVESDEMMRERAAGFLARMRKKHSNENVLVVAHGDFNVALISLITGKSFADVLDMAKWENTNVTIFEIGNGETCKMHRLNCTKHLNQNNYIPP